MRFLSCLLSSALVLSSTEAAFNFVLFINGHSTSGSCDSFFNPACETYFSLFCLRGSTAGRRSTDTSDCPLGAYRTRFTSRSGRISIQSSAKWEGDFQLFIQAFDDDDGFSNSDYLDDIFVEGSLSNNMVSSAMTFRGRQGRVSVTVQFQRTCDTHYYNVSCFTYCVPANNINGHFSCNAIDGSKICLPGYSNPDSNCTDTSDLLLDPCQSSPCGTGASCVMLDSFNFTCKCLAGYTGPECEEITGTNAGITLSILFIGFTTIAGIVLALGCLIVCIALIIAKKIRQKNRRSQRILRDRMMQDFTENRRSDNFAMDSINKSDSTSTLEDEPDGKVSKASFFEVKEGTPEYSNALKRFHETIGTQVTVLKLLRVKNCNICGVHKSVKKSIAGKYGQHSKNVEVMQLFHGLKEETVDDIMEQGFNRSFAKSANAAFFGMGVYFALNASYSAQEKYAVPNSDGVQHMFICSVIIGKVTKGSGDMRAAPCQPNSRHRYDTLVNDMDNPTIYVAMTDHQAVPKYLVKFKTLK